MQADVNILPIIPPIDPGLIQEQLTPERFVRKTNRDNNEIYEITAHDSPLVMQEIGRIREIAFRHVGSGTGKSADIDALDTSQNPYKQLIVWNPELKMIVGGYRYMEGWKAEKEEGRFRLGTARLFEYSDKFINDYLPYTIELGRSFIHPEFQSTSDQRKTFFVLDNLWNGLGSLITRNARLKYFTGQVSLYKSFDPLARDLIMYFFRKHCEDSNWLVRAVKPLDIHHPIDLLESILSSDDREQNLRILSREVRNLGENIPPLMNTYINLSPSMKSFGTVDNPYFNNMEDTGIMITIADIYASKKDRHL